MSMEMDTCRKSGIEEISNYAVRLQDKGDKEARENIDKLMIFYVSLGCKFATNEKVISKAKYCVTCYGRQCIRVVIEKDEFHITKDEFYIANEEYFSKQGIKVLNIDEYMKLITKLSNKQIMMKKTIEIECPDGYKPIYNAETGNVEIVPENIMGLIKTYEDARDYLSIRNEVSYNRSVDSLAKLQIILDALNEGYKFDLLTGIVWYPWVRFFRMNSVPKDAEVIGHFRYQGEKFALVGGRAGSGGGAGLGYFASHYDVGYAYSLVGMLACKSKEIAEYVSTQFGKLVFDACFARHFKGEEFEWLD